VPPAGQRPAPTFSASADEIEEVKILIREITGKDHIPPIILLNPNCSDLLPLRRWESDNYVLLARRLLARYDTLYILFTGAPDDGDLVEHLIRQVNSERCVSVAGKTTLRQLLILYSESQLLVTNDSGPAHFATLTPIDTIILFGPETPGFSRLSLNTATSSGQVWPAAHVLTPITIAG
jgi:ADP-heptose:LPS heptosyltransferase